MSDGVWRGKRSKSTVCGSIAYLADTANQNLAHPVHKVYIYLLSLLPSAGEFLAGWELAQDWRPAVILPWRWSFVTGPKRRQQTMHIIQFKPTLTITIIWLIITTAATTSVCFCPLGKDIYYLLTTRQIFSYLCIQWGSTISTFTNKYVSSFCQHPFLGKDSSYDWLVSKTDSRFNLQWKQPFYFNPLLVFFFRVMSNLLMKQYITLIKRHR